MRLKIILLILIIISVLLFSIFGFGLKKIVLEEMEKKVPDYNCDENNICTSCIVEGIICNCNENVCNCGNKTVDKNKCNISR